MPETDSIKPSNRSCPFILGVAGGSGSGKTYFSQALVQKLQEEFGENVCELVYQDNFYIDQSNRFDHDGGAVNFDHPESIDFELLAVCLEKLKSGQDTPIPTYDFATHKRRIETQIVKPKKIIIVDGILIFHAEQVRALFDELIFFETPEQLRYERRLHRDVKERGRTPDGVLQQFIKQVKPMHDLYVEPSKRHAHTVVKDIGHFETTLQNYFEKLKGL
ncbi:MAG: uridine kinase [Pseudobdellovibrio sp.]